MRKKKQQQMPPVKVRYSYWRAGKGWRVVRSGNITDTGELEYQAFDGTIGKTATWKKWTLHPHQGWIAIENTLTDIRKRA